MAQADGRRGTRLPGRLLPTKVDPSNLLAPQKHRQFGDVSEVVRRLDWDPCRPRLKTRRPVLRKLVGGPIPGGTSNGGRR